MMTEVSEFEIENDVLISYHGSEETVAVPEGIIRIEEHAFEGNKALKHIFLPDTVQKIGFRAFMDCDNLEKIEIPGNVMTIGAYSFKSCGNLRSVTLHEGLREIGLWAFGDCKNLKEISIPDTVKEIGQYALGFHEASYQERYVYGMYHSFYSGFHILHNDNIAAIKYCYMDIPQDICTDLKEFENTYSDKLLGPEWHTFLFDHYEKFREKNKSKIISEESLKAEFTKQILTGFYETMGNVFREGFGTVSETAERVVSGIGELLFGKEK